MLFSLSIAKLRLQVHTCADRIKEIGYKTSFMESEVFLVVKSENMYKISMRII